MGLDGYAVCKAWVFCGESSLSFEVWLLVWSCVLFLFYFYFCGSKKGWFLYKDGLGIRVFMRLVEHYLIRTKHQGDIGIVERLKELV